MSGLQKCDLTGLFATLLSRKERMSQLKQRNPFQGKINFHRSCPQNTKNSLYLHIVSLNNPLDTIPFKQPRRRTLAFVKLTFDIVWVFVPNTQIGVVGSETRTLRETLLLDISFLRSYKINQVIHLTVFALSLNKVGTLNYYGITTAAKPCVFKVLEKWLYIFQVLLEL